MTAISNPISIFWARYKRNRAAVFGLFTVLFMASIGLLAPWLVPSDPIALHLSEPGRTLSPPTMTFPMGTDSFGRDLMSRIIYGARTSLYIGFVAAGIVAVLGTITGAIAGYFGGSVDGALMRIVDIFLSIPSFFLILIVAALFGGNLMTIVAIIGLTTWPSTARLIRAEFLSLTKRDFVEAARVVGAPNSHIIFREILPNAIFPAIVNLSLTVSYAILTEASLSFLGIGDPTIVSWGWMVRDSMTYFRSAWWLAIYPGLAIAITVIAFNLLGDGLSDALNPKLRET